MCTTYFLNDLQVSREEVRPLACHALQLVVQSPGRLSEGLLLVLYLELSQGENGGGALTPSFETELVFSCLFKVRSTILLCSRHPKSGY